MLRPTLRLLSEKSPLPSYVSPPKPYINHYRAKRTWPPDFTKLSQKHQFRLERRYRRRAKLKWARPTWTKFVKLATWASVGFVAIYGVLFMETPETGNGVFDGIRGWYRSLGTGIFDAAPTRRDDVVVGKEQGSG